MRNARASAFTVNPASSRTSCNTSLGWIGFSLFWCFRHQLLRCRQRHQISSTRTKTVDCPNLTFSDNQRSIACAPQIFDLTGKFFEHVILSAMLNLPQLVKFFRISLRVLLDVLTVFRIGLRSRAALAAENLVLRKQLALYLERKKRPRRATDAVRFTMALLARFFEWRQALTIVKPDTLIRWHRKGFRLFWKRKSRRPGVLGFPTSFDTDCQYGSQQSLRGAKNESPLSSC
jgi:hypothetical protein